MDGVKSQRYFVFGNPIVIRGSPIFMILCILFVSASVPGDSTDEAVLDKGSSRFTSQDDEPGVVYQDDIDTLRPNRIAVMDVKDWGIIKIELFDNMTPITTGNFASLSSSGFYEGIKFHRCIDDFVAQTGDPNTKDNNLYNDGSGGSGDTIPLEIHPNATHVDGAVGMARSDAPDSASSQFYICDGPQHGLDDAQRMEEKGQHGYAVFGVVVEGLDIAKSIAGTETYGKRRPLLKDHPVDDITITSITIIQPEMVTEEDPLDEGHNLTWTQRVNDIASGPWGILFGIDLVVFVALMLWMMIFRKNDPL